MDSSKTTTQPSDLYTPLKAGENSGIRLLTVLPGGSEDLIDCTLQTYVLNDSPSYETVSYVWGDKDDRTAITVSGREISVPVSAAAVLRRLRHEYTERTLWIDALCINQADLGERSHQVAMMTKVYRTATANLIQLDDTDQDTASRASQSIQALSREIGEETNGRKDLRKVLLSGHTQRPIRAAIDIDALEALLSCRWFRYLPFTSD